MATENAISNNKTINDHEGNQNNNNNNNNVPLDEIIMVQMPDGSVMAAKVINSVELKANVQPSAPLEPIDDNHAEGKMLVNNQNEGENITQKPQKPPKPTKKPISVEEKKNQSFVDDINYDYKDTLFRKPSKSRNYCNLLYGIINTVNVIYLWVIFIASFVYIDQVTIGHYCNKKYVMGDECNSDILCNYIDEYVNSRVPQPGCIDSYGDQCCAMDVLSGNAVMVVFYLFLGINTARVLVITPLIHLVQSNSDLDSYKVMDADSKQIEEVKYATWLCDNPSIYFLQNSGDNMNNKIQDAILRNVVLPNTLYLLANCELLYIPLCIIVSYLTEQQIKIYITVDNAEFGFLFICLLGVMLLFIGFIMTVHRWRKTIIIKQQNIMEYEKYRNRKIKIYDDSEKIEHLCTGCCEAVKEMTRNPLKEPKKFNVIYRWINFIVFIYFWMILTYSIAKYRFDGGGVIYGAMIPIPVLLAIHTVRFFIIDFLIALYNVNNRINYFLNEKTKRVKLRPFMDYLSDNPVGIIIGILYKDVNDALNEGVIYDITFPDKTSCIINMLLLYVPLFAVSFVQVFYVTDILYLILWIIASIACCIGFITNWIRARYH